MQPADLPFLLAQQRVIAALHRLLDGHQLMFAHGVTRRQYRPAYAQDFRLLQSLCRFPRYALVVTTRYSIKIGVLDCVQALVICAAGNVAALNSLPHIHIPTADVKDKDVCMRTSTTRASFSQKPPLSPHCPASGPCSFSASFSSFAADRVQSSPCIMQTEHADSASMQTGSCCVEAEAFQLDESLPLMPTTSLARPSRLSSETKLSDLMVEDIGSELEFQLPPLLIDESTGASAQNAGTMQEHPSNTVKMSAQCKRQVHSDSSAHVGSVCHEETAPDAMLLDRQVCMSSSGLGVATSAAFLSCATASSSPCCIFPVSAALPQGDACSPSPASAALTHGIASSPALRDTSSEGSARRKSLSPLDTGPVSILPMVENPETGLPSITCQTVAQLLTGQLSTQLTALKIVDCR